MLRGGDRGQSPSAAVGGQDPRPVPAGGLTLKSPLLEDSICDTKCLHSTALKRIFFQIQLFVIMFYVSASKAILWCKYI